MCILLSYNMSAFKCFKLSRSIFSVDYCRWNLILNSKYKGSTIEICILTLTSRCRVATYEFSLCIMAATTCRRRSCTGVRASGGGPSEGGGTRPLRTSPRHDRSSSSNWNDHTRLVTLHKQQPASSLLQSRESSLFVTLQFLFAANIYVVYNFDIDLYDVT